MNTQPRESVRRITIEKRSENAELLRHSSSKGAPGPIFDALAARFPDYVVAGSRIELKRPLSDPALEDLMAAAMEAGLTPQQHRADVPAQVQFLDYRAYSETEIDAAPLLTCERHSPFIGSVDFDPQSPCAGLHVLRDQWFERCKSREFGSLVNLYHLLAVRGAAKSALESAGLKGLKLTMLPTDSPEGDWPDGIEPLHLLWSDQVLPEVDADLFDNRHEVFRSNQRDFTNLQSECYLLGGHDVSPPLRYRHLDLSGFDVAITRERFGGKQPCYHQLVYSQKARQVLERLDRQLIFKPVLIS